MKLNISQLSHCYGCGVCTIVCPVKIISLEINTDGFYEPKINNQSKCIECGLCLKVCSFYQNENLSITGKTYIGCSKDNTTRLRCSSGGIAYEIAKYGINSQSKICSVRYNNKAKRAEHYISNSIEDLNQSIGSKYLQSFTPIGLEQINWNDKYIVFGLPCQISSIRNYIKLRKVEDNFVLIDFFCHGVPSMLLWEQYLKLIESSYGEYPTEIKWRDKQKSWQRSYCMNGQSNNKEFYSSRESGDLFYKFFLGNYCLNACCYDSCKFKQLNSSADIRLGDAWGIKVGGSEKGINSIIGFTNKGNKLIQQLQKSAVVEEIPKNEILSAQMHKPASRPKIQRKVLLMLKRRSSLKYINRSVIIPYELSIIFPKRIVNKILRVIKIRFQFPLH